MHIQIITKLAQNPKQDIKKLWGLLLSTDLEDISQWTQQRLEVEEKLPTPDFSIELLIGMLCTYDLSDIIKHLGIKNKDFSETNLIDYLDRRNLEITSLACRNTIWHCLAKGGHDASLRVAIATRKFNPNTLVNDCGHTIWHIFAIFNYIEQLIIAIADGMFNPETLTTKNNQTVLDLLSNDNKNLFRGNAGDTIWHLVALYGLYNRLLEGIKHKQFNHITLTNMYNFTVWHSMAKGGHDQELCLAIDAGLCDPNVVTNLGWTVWHIFAYFGHYDKLLLAITKYKFNPNNLIDYDGNNVWSLIPYDTWCSLIVDNRIDELMDCISSGKFNPIKVKNTTNEKTIWHELASLGYINELLYGIYKQLFDPIQLLDKNGFNVWDYLAAHGHSGKVSLLINLNIINPSLKNKYQKTVWSYVPKDKINPPSKYVYCNSDPLLLSQGKNKDSRVVSTTSKLNQQQKIWVQKPFCGNYNFFNGIKDAVFGQLAVHIFGKRHAPKTKFNLQYPAIVSRVIGDPRYKVTNYRNFIKIKDGFFLSKEAQLSLVQTLCYGVVINDRDLSAKNIVVIYINDNKVVKAQQIYGIDHEIAVFKGETNISLTDFYKRCYNSRKELLDIIITNAAGWSQIPGEYDKASKNKLDSAYNNTLYLMTDEDVKNTFDDIIEKISHDNFCVCQEVKESIYKQINQPDSIYPEYIINKYVMPKIDSLIDELKMTINSLKAVTPKLKPLPHRLI